MQDARIKTVETIQVRAEFLFELASKNQWVNRVPRCLPNKIRGGESWIWVDKNGNVFECGADFIEAEKHETYPCKVYRLSSVADWSNNQIPVLNAVEVTSNQLTP